MRDYNKTLWENNVTIIDADSLNNVENQLSSLTAAQTKDIKDIEDLQAQMPLKASKDHTHPEYVSQQDISEIIQDVSAIEGEITAINDSIDSVEADMHGVRGSISAAREEIVALGNALQDEIRTSISEFYDNVELTDTFLEFYSNGVLKKRIELPTMISPNIAAVCGEFLSGEVLCGEGVERSTFSNGTTWIDYVTPVNAENLNKIESKLIELAEKIRQFESEGIPVSETFIHAGEDAPDNTNLLWIAPDESDMVPDEAMEMIASALSDHNKKILDLYSLLERYIDGGTFEDVGQESLDGGVF